MKSNILTGKEAKEVYDFDFVNSDFTLQGAKRKLAMLIKKFDEAGYSRPLIPKTEEDFVFITLLNKYKELKDF